MIDFVPLAPSHIPQLHQWLNHGEALRWYGRRASTETAVRESYLPKPTDDPTHRGFIIHVDQEPIGYLQYYRIAGYSDYAQLVSALPGDYGLDLFIGRDDLIGRGLGPRIIRAALENLVFSQPDAQRCLIDPSSANFRAIRCYEKAGFTYARTIVSPTDGEEVIMICARPADGAPRLQ